MWLVGTHQRSRRGQGRRRHLLSSLVLLSRSSAPTDVMTTVVVPHESWRWLHMKVGATLAHTTSFLTQGTSSSNQTPWTYNRPLPPAWKTRNVLPGKLFLIPGAHWPITGARLPEEVFTFWGHERDMACELWTTERDKEVLVDNGEPGLLGSWALMCVFSSFLHRTTRSGVLSPFTFYNLITASHVDVMSPVWLRRVCVFVNSTDGYQGLFPPPPVRLKVQLVVDLPVDPSGRVQWRRRRLTPELIYLPAMPAVMWPPHDAVAVLRT